MKTYLSYGVREMVKRKRLFLFIILSFTSVMIVGLNTGIFMYGFLQSRIEQAGQDYHFMLGRLDESDLEIIRSVDCVESVRGEEVSGTVTAYIIFKDDFAGKFKIYAEEVLEALDPWERIPYYHNEKIYYDAAGVTGFWFNPIYMESYNYNYLDISILITILFSFAASAGVLLCFHIKISSTTTEYGILSSLGMKKRQVFMINLLQLFICEAISFFIAFPISYIVMEVSSHIAKKNLYSLESNLFIVKIPYADVLFALIFMFAFIGFGIGLMLKAKLKMPINYVIKDIKNINVVYSGYSGKKFEQLAFESESEKDTSKSSIAPYINIYNKRNFYGIFYESMCRIFIMVLPIAAVVTSIFPLRPMIASTKYLNQEDCVVIDFIDTFNSNPISESVKEEILSVNGVVSYRPEVSNLTNETVVLHINLDPDLRDSALSEIEMICDENYLGFTNRYQITRNIVTQSSYYFTLYICEGIFLTICSGIIIFLLNTYVFSSRKPEFALIRVLGLKSDEIKKILMRDSILLLPAYVLSMIIYYPIMFKFFMMGEFDLNIFMYIISFGIIQAAVFFAVSLLSYRYNLRRFAKSSISENLNKSY